MLWSYKHHHLTITPPDMYLFLDEEFIPIHESTPIERIDKVVDEDVLVMWIARVWNYASLFKWVNPPWWISEKLPQRRFSCLYWRSRTIAQCGLPHCSWNHWLPVVPQQQGSECRKKEPVREDVRWVRVWDEWGWESEWGWKRFSKVGHAWMKSTFSISSPFWAYSRNIASRAASSNTWWMG